MRRQAQLQVKEQDLITATAEGFNSHVSQPAKGTLLQDLRQTHER